MAFQEFVIEIDETNHEEFLENGLAVLNFFSDGHMQSLMMMPFFEQIAEEFSEKICFGKCNIEEWEKVADMHEVESIPTIIIFRDGDQIDRIEKSITEEILRDRLGSILNIA